MIGRSSRDVVLVLGRPGAGKSTLASSLARILGGSHLAVGELIRSARCDPATRERTQRAFEGREMFDAAWLADEIALALRSPGFARGPLFVDAAPPIGEVARRLAWSKPTVLLLDASMDTARARRAARRAQRRADDQEATFRRRSEWCMAHLDRTVAKLGAEAAVYRVDAEYDVGDVCRQALSAVLTQCVADWRSSRARPEAVFEPADFGSLKAFLDESTRRFGATEVALRPSDGAASGNAFVLLVKPGLSYGDDIFRFIASHARKFGYRVERAAAWSGEAIRQSQIGRAHLDIAYLWAAWPEEIDPHRRWIRPAENEFIVGGFDHARAVGREQLAAVWKEDGPYPPTKRAPSAWAVNLEESGRTKVIVNGHIPDFLDLFETDGNVAYALLLVAADRRAASWSAMRREFLGETEPRRAHPGSLRREAAEGRIPVRGRVDFRNNAFHLSAGPLEALRECDLWFGDRTAAALADRFGVDLKLARLNRPLEGGRFATLWSNEATECCDTWNPAFLEIAGALG